MSAPEPTKLPTAELCYCGHRRDCHEGFADKCWGSLYGKDNGCVCPKFEGSGRWL